MFIAILVVLGLCFGSFINALAWRLHKQDTKSQKSKVKSQKYSILQGRSMCPNCEHVLAWYDLLPVVSWVGLGGKCRYCHKPISWQYPIVELTTAGLFVISYMFWPSFLLSNFSILFPFWLVFLVGFIALAVYDLHWMILPDRLVKPLQVFAVSYVLVRVIALDGGWSVARGAILAVLSSAGVFYILYRVSKGSWIGGGDVKLAVVLGLLLGSLTQSFLMIFIASFIGSMIAIPLLLLGKAKQDTKLPFGPLLIAATIIVFLFGADLIRWYDNQFFL